MALKHAVLMQIAATPNTIGYQIYTRIRDAVGDAWRLTNAAVTLQLKEAAKQGHVTVKANKNGHKTYSITATGRAEIEAWLNVEPAPQEGERDDLTFKLLWAANHEPHDGLAVQLAQRLGDARERLHRATLSMSDPPPPDIDADMYRLHLQRLRTKAEADVIWLEATAEAMATRWAKTRPSRRKA